MPNVMLPPPPSLQQRFLNFSDVKNVKYHNLALRTESEDGKREVITDIPETFSPDQGIDEML